MTALTATMSASIQCLGAEPTDKWASYNWNAFIWGAGTAPVPKIVVKQINPQSVGSTSGTDFVLRRLLAAQSIAGTSGFGKNVVVGLATQSVGSTSAMEHEYLQDAHGYYHVFPEQVTDFVLSTTPTWQSATSTPITWATQVAGTTSWS